MRNAVAFVVKTVRVLKRIRRYTLSEDTVWFATDKDGAERKKNEKTAALYGLETRDRIKIVHNLRLWNFSEIKEEKMKSLDDYEGELYVFFVRKRLVDVDGAKARVWLYIKLQFMKPSGKGILVISFHVAEHDVKKLSPFKKGGGV